MFHHVGWRGAPLLGGDDEEACASTTAGSDRTGNPGVAGGGMGGEQSRPPGRRIASPRLLMAYGLRPKAAVEGSKSGGGAEPITADTLCCLTRGITITYPKGKP